MASWTIDSTTFDKGFKMFDFAAGSTVGVVDINTIDV